MPDRPQPFRFSARAERTKAQPIAYLMDAAIANPDLISLAAGFVDDVTLPTEEVADITRKVLADETRGPLALQYGSTQGLAELRHALLEHLANLDGVTPADLDASPDDIVITNGSQQLLYLLTDLLVDPGDIVVCGWPSYFVYTGALQTFDARVRGVEMDEGGIIPEKLDARLAELAAAGELSRVKIVYIVDYHQNPTGLTLAADRRERVLEIVKRYSAEHRILLIEDAAYRELTFEGEPPPSIKSFDKDNRFVALLQTFSKPFAPGVKTGYGLLPRDLVEPVELQKANHDFGTSHLCQHILLEALKSGTYTEHLKVLRQAYIAKRDAMLEALEEHLGDFEPGQTHWTRPTGGMYIWLSLPPTIDTRRDGPLFSKAVGEGVLYVPGNYCFGDDATQPTPNHQMRLSFGLANPHLIREGIKRLGRAIRSCRD